MLRGEPTSSHGGVWNTRAYKQKVFNTAHHSNTHRILPQVGLEPSRIVPTVGLNVGRMEVFGTNLVFWDLGGAPGLRVSATGVC